MSSEEKTLGYGEDWRLFQEGHERDRVWLALRGNSFSASIEIGARSLDGKPDPRVLLGIDVTTWRKLVEAWNRSSWASTPEQDHQPEEIELVDFFR